MNRIRAMTVASRGDRRPRLALVALLACSLMVGQLGAFTHEVGHLSDLQLDATCLHCVAGDGKTPLAERVQPGPQLDTLTTQAATFHLAPAQRPLPSAHPVRAPPSHA